MKEFITRVVDELHQSLKESLSREQIEKLIEVPKQAEKADFSFPCFSLAKSLRKNPAIIAQELADSFSTEGVDARAENAYLNFTVKRDQFSKSIIENILEHKEHYGHSDEGKGLLNIVEYSSANISKEMHIGYIRGIMIGSSLYKISQALGYETVAINHLGDYGINFGMIIVAYKRWGSEEDLQQGGNHYLNMLYVKFREEEKKDASLTDEARAWFKRLEAGDEEAYGLWQHFKEISLRDFQVVYERLGSHFDSYAGESFYSDKMPAARQELLEKGLISLDQGAEIIDLEDEHLPNIIVTSSNGTSLYITRDIAAALYRYNHYHFNKNIYVVGSEQRLHFQQLKAIIKKMGYGWYKDMIHVDHGLINLEGGGKISSREGNVTLLNDVLDVSIEKSLELINQKNPDLEDKEEIARMVGFGAIAFRELSTSRVKDYTFRWEDALSFEGETGPYIQYTNVRCHSLLSKRDVKFSEAAYDTLDDPFSSELLRELSLFTTTIQNAFSRYEPAIISRYLINVAKLFNKFYQNVTILTESDAECAAKLALVKSVSQVLENGMNLINMEAPKRM